MVHVLEFGNPWDVEGCIKDPHITSDCLCVSLTHRTQHQSGFEAES